MYYQESPKNMERRSAKRLERTHIRIRAERSRRDENGDLLEFDKPTLVAMAVQIERYRLSKRSQEEVNIGIMERGESIYSPFATRKTRNPDADLAMFEDIFNRRDAALAEEEAKMSEERKERFARYITEQKIFDTNKWFVPTPKT